jgi:7-cyano-7-deazaguanine synthase
MQKKALILLSGGLDSITVLALAQKQGFLCYTLSFNYGQRHNAELIAAQKIATHYGVAEHKIIHLGLDAIGGSALTDKHIAVPQTLQTGIPVTYVPARNTIFLSFALGWAEVLQCDDIFIGVNAVDYSGYPDCRPEFIQAFQTLANLATKAGVEGEVIKIHTPLIALSKAQIIQQGLALGIDYSQTVSCYSADTEGRACGTCDACRLRKIGFQEAGVTDPTRYQ